MLSIVKAVASLYSEEELREVGEYRMTMRLRAAARAPQTLIYTGYNVENGFIWGPESRGEYWIRDGYILGPGNATAYRVRGGRIYGPDHSGEFLIDGPSIYGPHRSLPWLR